MVVYRTYPIVQQAILLDGIVLNDHERLQVCNFDVFSVFSFGLGRSKVTIGELQAVIDSHPEEQFSQVINREIFTHLEGYSNIF